MTGLKLDAEKNVAKSRVYEVPGFDGIKTQSLFVIDFEVVYEVPGFDGIKTYV